MSEKTSRSWTECICPFCNKKHKLQIFWTGKGIARKYCKEHQHEINRIDDSLLFIDKPEKPINNTGNNKGDD